MKKESGQALVLVLLSLAVVLTLVLFILSRSVTDILTSSKNEETSRAFSAAEAGIEQALVIGSGGSNPNIGNSAGYISSVTNLGQGSTDFNYPLELASGDTYIAWFVSHSADGSSTLCDATHPCFTGNTIKVCWGKVQSYTDPSKIPAIEFSAFYDTVAGNDGTVQIGRTTVDPNAARTSTNNFGPADAGTCTIAGVNYQFQKTITFSSMGLLPAYYNTANSLQFAKIRMLYNDITQPIGITTNFAGSSSLPSQGQSIISTGTSGQSTRRIDVFQGWPEAPSSFDYAIYSSTGVVR